jgi:hypothetical protein
MAKTMSSSEKIELCPLCNKQLRPSRDGNSVKYFCNCSGYDRPVIEILKEGEKQNGSTD